MNNKKLFVKTNDAGFLLRAVLLAALAGCAGNAGAQDVKIIVAPPVVVVAPPVVAAPVVVEQDDYVYYPNYEVYYNSHRHQYAHLEGGVWIWTPAPNGIAMDVLLASPSVHMDWHDSLENHHAEMLQRYPRDWQPAGEHHDMKELRRDAGPGHDRKPPE